MKFLRVVIIGLSFFLAAKAGAFELRLNCKTTSEEVSIYNDDYEILDTDPTIKNKNVELLISDNELQANFRWFQFFKCLEVSTIVTDDEIKARCLDMRFDSRTLNDQDYKWSVKVNRYSGRLETSLHAILAGERTWYKYEGMCSRSKKKLF